MDIYCHYPTDCLRPTMRKRRHREDQSRVLFRTDALVYKSKYPGRWNTLRPITFVECLDFTNVGFHGFHWPSIQAGWREHVLECVMRLANRLEKLALILQNTANFSEQTGHSLIYPSAMNVPQLCLVLLILVLFGTFFFPESCLLVA